MTRFFRVPLRRCLVAGLVFFALVLSLGHAMAGDSGSAEGGGPVGVTVTNQAPVVTQFAIGTNTVNQNYSFRIPLELRSQIRQANDPTASGTSGYDDLGSWNAQFVALDNGGNNVTRQQSEVSGVFYEFGVFKYTGITLVGSPWTGGSIAPGASATTGTRNVVHESNAPYKLSVYVTTTLTSPTDTIAFTTIMVTAARRA